MVSSGLCFLFHFALLMLAGNGLWYGVVRDYEAKTYQFTPTFLRAVNRRKP